MNPYDHYVLPYLIDVACGMKAIQRQRATLVSQARGRVLEIGIGTGRNLPFYDRDKLESLQGLDPAAQMHGRSEEHTSELQSLMRISYAVFCFKKKIDTKMIFDIIYMLLTQLHTFN